MQGCRLLVSVVVGTERRVEHVNLNSITIWKKRFHVSVFTVHWSRVGIYLQIWENSPWTICHYLHHVGLVGILYHRQTVGFEWIWRARHLRWFFVSAVPIQRNYTIESVAARIASICVDSLTHADTNAAKAKTFFSFWIWNDWYPRPKTLQPSFSKSMYKKHYADSEIKLFIHASFINFF